MINEKLSSEAQNPPLRKGVVISRFNSLKESIEVVIIIWVFIFLLFSGVIIAPLFSATKWFIKSYSKYYEWLFDWYVSKNGI